MLFAPWGAIVPVDRSIPCAVSPAHSARRIPPLQRPVLRDSIAPHWHRIHIPPSRSFPASVKPVSIAPRTAPLLTSVWPPISVLWVARLRVLVRSVPTMCRRMIALRRRSTVPTAPREPTRSTRITPCVSPVHRGTFVWKGRTLPHRLISVETRDINARKDSIVHWGASMCSIVPRERTIRRWQEGRCKRVCLA